MDGDVGLGTILATIVVVAGKQVIHVGLVSAMGPWGPTHVIHSSKFAGGVVETSVDEFASVSRRVWAHPYPGFKQRLAGWVVVERARARLGEAWSLWVANCEHFVFGVHGYKPVSPQLRQALGVGAGSAAAACLAVAVARS